MRVLVTSDTHVASAAHLPASLLRLAERADHVLHAGDLVAHDVVDVLAGFAPVTAVHGNCDDSEVVARLPERAEVELEGVLIGVVHIPGAAAGRGDRLTSWFPRCQLVVYGHTHQPDVPDLARRSPWILNPGSPVQRRAAAFHSAAWLELSEGRIDSVELVDLDQT